jgi:hypothetical protein
VQGSLGGEVKCGGGETEVRADEVIKELILVSWSWILE